jgi:hypothetical protein
VAVVYFKLLTKFTWKFEEKKDQYHTAIFRAQLQNWCLLVGFTNYTMAVSPEA